MHSYDIALKPISPISPSFSFFVNFNCESENTNPFSLSFSFRNLFTASISTSLGFMSIFNLCVLSLLIGNNEHVLPTFALSLRFCAREIVGRANGGYKMLWPRYLLFFSQLLNLLFSRIQFLPTDTKSIAECRCVHSQFLK